MRRPSHDGGETLVESPTTDHQQLVKENPELGQALTRENAQVSQHVDGAIYLKNNSDDPDAPRAWPTWKKYCVVGLARYAHVYSHSVQVLTIQASWLNNLGTPYHHSRWGGIQLNLPNPVTIGASGYSKLLSAGLCDRPSPGFAGTGVEELTEEFGVSAEIGTLGLSLWENKP